MLSLSIVTPNTGGANFNGQTWFAALYNYLLGGWEQKYSSTQSGTLGGTSYASTAWYGGNLVDNSCQTVAGTRVADIIFNEYTGLSWVSTHYPSQTFAFQTSNCFSGAFSFTYPATFNNPLGNAWQASTPNP